MTVPLSCCLNTEMEATLYYEIHQLKRNHDREIVQQIQFDFASVLIQTYRLNQFSSQKKIKVENVSIIFSLLPNREHLS